MATLVQRYLRSNATNTSGGDGTADTDTGATRAYLTAALAESTEEGVRSGLVVRDEKLRYTCRGGVENTGGFTVNGFTTDRSTDNIIQWIGDGTYQITRSDDRAIGVADDDIDFINLRVRAQGDQFGISDVGVGAGGEIYVEQCLIYNSDDPGSEDNRGRAIAAVAGTWYIGWNNIRGFYNSTTVGYGIGVAGATVYAYSNFVDRCRIGIVLLSGAATIRNNGVSDCQNSCYNGSWTASSGNASSDATSPQTTLRSKTFVYVDKANWDLHLDPSATDLVGTGTDLSADANYPQDVDFDGLAYASWDGVNIGSDQFEAAGGTSSLLHMLMNHA
jgi:hypothetical protein